MFKWFSWMGRISPAQRAQSEVEEIDRLLYDADKAVHDAQATVLHLRGRRQFLEAEYDLDVAPTPRDHIALSGDAHIGVGEAVVQNFDRHRTF